MSLKLLGFNEFSRTAYFTQLTTQNYRFIVEATNIYDAPVHYLVRNSPIDTPGTRCPSFLRTYIFAGRVCHKYTHAYTLTCQKSLHYFF